ncbi:hypothetical protein [Clostridium cadaveris]|uniref:hypothetical protein n=1 Tax=Clostridium cadaveris TaxID=1529 RepID=UPI0031D50A10
MKKYICILLILIGLTFNPFVSTTAFAKNIFNEGIYTSSDFNFSSNETYFVQNISSNNSAHITIYNENQLILQSIHLNPKSAKFDLIPLKPSYRVVIVGNGKIFIDKDTK